MKRKKIRVLFLLTMLLMNTLMYSQGPGNGNGNGPPFPCPPHNPVCGGQPGLPINNGVPILLLLGALFGAYKIYSNKFKTLKKPL